jgi:sugar phosphate permease
VRWYVFVLSCAASWLLYIHRYSWSVIRPALKADYPDLTDPELGWLDSAFSATYMIGQIPGGVAGDVFGVRGVLSAIILLWSLMLAALAVVHGFWMMAGVRGMFGLAQAGTYPILGKVTRVWFPLEIRTSVQGAVAALGRVGGACASLVVATILMGLFDLQWRLALLVLAVPGLALAGCVWMVFRNSPREHPWVNAAEQELIDNGEQAPSAGGSPRLRLTGAHAFSVSMVLLYTFASTFADQLFVNWIPQFLVEAKGLSATDMGIFATLPLLGGALGGIAGGMLNDWLIRKSGNRRWARSAVGLTGKLVAAALLALSVWVGDGRLVMVVLLVCKFFCDWALPTLWGTITDMGGKASGTVFAIVNTIGALGGFAAGPVIGYVKQQYGWDGLFYTIAGVFLAAGLCWLFIDCTCKLVEEGTST